MKRVLTAIVLIPLVLLVLFKAPMWLFTLVVGVVAMGAAWEYLRLADLQVGPSSKLLPLSLAALVFLFAAVGKIPGLLSGHGFVDNVVLNLPAMLMLCAPFIIIAFAMSHADLKTGFLQGTASAFVFPYVIWSLMTLVIIRERPEGIALILFLFTAVWAGDVFAYYVGRAIGRHKLAPRISPGKTWEGAVASVIASVLLAHILFVHQADIGAWIQGTQVQDRLEPLRRKMSLPELRIVGVTLAFIVNVVAQVGDLVESMIKRGAGVKDSGTLLPGHGGILDRIDALLFAAPVLFFYTMLNPIWTFYSPFDK